MKSTFDRAISGVIAISAVAIAVSVVYRTLRPPTVEARPAGPHYVKGWEKALRIGYRLGNASAPVTIVELADLQCPVCKTFHSTLGRLIRDFPNHVSVVHVPYPLSYHKSALPAARAAECAAAQGRIEAWLDVIYAKQDSLNIKSWGSFAHEAGIADTAAIHRCATDTLGVARITNGLAFGKQIGLVGTPTVLVNGWMLPDVPSHEQLKGAVESIVRGNDPFAKGRWVEP